VLVFDAGRELGTPSDARAQSELMRTMLESGIIQPTANHDTCIIGLDPELALAVIRRLNYSVVFVSGPVDEIGVRFSSNWDMVDVRGLQTGADPGTEYEARIRVISYHSLDSDSVIRDYSAARVGGKWSFQVQEGETH
jgi:hypothetical protein